MTTSKKVKCIYIDAQTKSISYVDWEIPLAQFPQLSQFQKAVFYRSDKFGSGDEGVTPVLFYKAGVITDPANLPKYGFLWRTSGDLNDKFDLFDSEFRDVSGNGLVVFFENYLERKKGSVPNPCDAPISLEQAGKMVLEYTDGVYWRLPEFTCILNKAFSESGYELLLRIENDAFLEYQHWHEVTKPVRMLSPQIINFAVDYKEISIVTGKIESLDDKVRVVIYEAGTSDLRQVAACTLTASKIPQWVQDRLRNYFFEKFVAERFASKYRDRKPQLHVVESESVQGTDEV